MSFTSTFNSLSTNGWTSKDSTVFIYEVSKTISPAQSVQLSRSIGINYAGNIIIAGAPLYDKTVGNVTYTDAGGVVTYSGSDATWTQNQILTGSNVVNSDTQGYNISISGDGNYIGFSASLGLLPNLAGDGSVYVFNSNGVSYNEQTQLFSGNAVINGSFGSAISLDQYGNYMCVGASNELISTIRTGAAYIFSRSGNSWSQQQRLTPSDTGYELGFGESCAIDSTGTYAVVGATMYTGANNHTGAAYIYSRVGTVWTQLQRLTPSSPAVPDQFFGKEVEISENGNTIVVAGPGTGIAYGPDGGGSVWIYSKSGNTWSETQRINSSTPLLAQFGYGLALDATGNWLLISDPVSISLNEPTTEAYYLQSGNFNYIQSFNQVPTTTGDYAQQLACSNNASYVVVNNPGISFPDPNQGLFEIYKNTKA